MLYRKRELRPIGVLNVWRAALGRMGMLVNDWRKHSRLKIAILDWRAPFIAPYNWFNWSDATFERLVIDIMRQGNCTKMRLII